MEIDNNSKVLALNKIQSTLTSLELSSGYYQDKEAFKKFIVAYENLTDNIIQFIKDDYQRCSLETIEKELKEKVDYIKTKKTQEAQS